MNAPISISVVIPMLNEECFIRPCLESILAGDLPPGQYEVLVVDGGSADRSPEIVRDISQRHANVRLLQNPKRIAAAAMNEGIRAARGEYIIRMDAHCEYAANYLRSSIEELLRTGADNVGGRWQIRPGSPGKLAKAIALFGHERLAVGNVQYRLGQDGEVDTVPFGAFRRELFKRLGGYREDLQRREDYELNSRIRNSGGKIFLSPLLESVYYAPPTLNAFWRKLFGNGFWSAYSMMRYPRSFLFRHAVPMLFVIFLLSIIPSVVFDWPVLPIQIILLLIYVAILLLAAARNTIQHGVEFFLLLPPLMFSGHLAYGLGSLYGLIKTPLMRRAED